jgi:fructoselysine-6-P-deglycase FrlB-like protein
MTTTPEWHTDAYPELRDAPPWVMQEMIEAQPALLEQIATGADASALALLARTAGRLDVVGCGTSEHAALGIAEILSDAGRPASARQAFEARLEPGEPAGVIGVSHEGGTRATIDAMRAARAAGAAVGLITAVADGEATRDADAAIVTPMVDRSWCHTVGYTSPLAAGVALAATVSGTPVPAGAVQRLAEGGLTTREQAAAVAERLGGLARLIVVGSGADRTAARELTLKVEEACHLPSAMRDLETFLHGHIPATGPDTGLVLILTDSRQAAARAERAEALLRASARVGIACAAITTAALPGGLLPAGTIAAPPAPELGAAAASLLGTALPLQWLAYELAIARDTNPDLIRREQDDYRAASEEHG